MLSSSHCFENNGDVYGDAVEDLDGVLIAFEVDRKISTRREFAEPDIV